mgnify:CR=1 FL=1
MGNRIIKTEDGARIAIPAESRVEAALLWGKAIWQGDPVGSLDRFSQGERITVVDEDGEQKLIVIFAIQIFEDIEDDPTEDLPSEFETSVQ